MRADRLPSEAWSNANCYFEEKADPLAFLLRCVEDATFSRAWRVAIIWLRRERRNENEAEPNLARHVSEMHNNYDLNFASGMPSSTDKPDCCQSRLRYAGMIFWLDRHGQFMGTRQRCQSRLNSRYISSTLPGALALIDAIALASANRFFTPWRVSPTRSSYRSCARRRSVDHG